MERINRSRKSTRSPEKLRKLDILDFLEIDSSEIDYLKNNKNYHIKNIHGKCIYSPSSRLKSVQKKLVVFFSPMLKQHEAVHSYRFGKSVKSCVHKHLLCDKLLKTDIVNFFGSIPRNEIEAYLKHVVSFRMVDLLSFFKKNRRVVDTMLNWNAVREDGVSLSRLYLTSQCAEDIAEIVTYEDKLVIGAPTSPILSNAVLYRMDSRIQNFCFKRNFVYTRYADDILISSTDYNKPKYIDIYESQKRFHIGNLYKFLPILTGILSYYGFNINHKKTKIMNDKSRKSVFGIVLNREKNLLGNGKLKSGGLRTSRKYRRNVRAEKHQLKLAQEKAEKGIGFLDYNQNINQNKLNGKDSWIKYVTK